LNNDGIGFESWIIEAIEYITDPNGDGETFDHFDIASISLGGGGNPDDPISQAVDNAVDKGVVVVVAAGNSGGQAIDGGTISSPGVARKAITVGASDKDDWMAYFSSTGPVIVNINEILIKPDVVAPGYRVCAARLPGSEIDNKIKEEKRESEFFICDDDDYYALSGTSMATPVVSGVVALLLQAHPDWEPEMVKSALMNNAKDLSFNPFTQGAGRIDALKTYNTDAIITPGSSVLGINYLDDNEIWIAKKEFKITNLLDKTVLYNISYYIDQEGIISKIDRNSILLRPYGTSYFNLTLEVNNSLVPDKIYPWYHGKIIAESQYNNLNIPVSFAKIGIIEFHLDNKTHIVSAINDNGSVKWLFYPEEISKVMLPKGNYYFLSLIPYVCPDWYNKSLCWGHQNSYVTLDSIEHKGYTVVYMNRSSVKHKINMSLINENGVDLDPLIRPGGEGTAPRRDCGRHGYEEPCYDGWGTLLYFESPNGTWIKLGLSSGGTNDPNFFSDTSNLWKFSMVRRVVDNDKYYIFKNWTKSIKNDIEFKNGPNDFNKVKFTYKIPPDITDSWRFIWCEYATIAKYYTAMYGTSSFGRTIWNNYNESLFVIPNRDFPIDVCNFTSTT
ncbi:MAG: S8 family serine peptidase, partial [Candidatus Aenigmatarchaeota archaeon]